MAKDDLANSPRLELLAAGRLLNAGRGVDAIAGLEGLAARGLVGIGEITRLRYLAIAQRQAGRPKAARSTAEVAVMRATEAGAVDERIRAQALVANIAAEMGDAPAAIGMLETCVMACDDDSVIDPDFLLGALLSLGAASHAVGDRARAAAAYRRALAVAADLVTPEGRSAAYAAASDRHAERGEHAAADHFAQKSVFVHEQQRLRSRLTDGLAAASDFFSGEGDWRATRSARAMIDTLR